MAFNDDQYIFYEPSLGKMLGMGNRQHIETNGNRYIDQLLEMYRMMGLKYTDVIIDKGIDISGKNY